MEIGDAVAQRFMEYVDDDQRFIIDVDSRTILFAPAFGGWAAAHRAVRPAPYKTRGANLVTALLRVCGLALRACKMRSATRRSKTPPTARWGV